MGKLISKIVFMPPPYYSHPDDDFIYIKSEHNSRIQFKYINRNARYNLLISHGNAEDIISVMEWVITKLLKYIDVNIILYGKLILNKTKYLLITEYTGYGENEDNLKPSEEFIYKDIERVYNYVTQEMFLKPENIILYGRSLGSGPSCYLAEKYPVGG